MGAGMFCLLGEWLSQLWEYGRAEGEEWEKEWVEGGKELWEVIERFLEERGI